MVSILTQPEESTTESPDTELFYMGSNTHTFIILTNNMRRNMEILITSHNSFNLHFQRFLFQVHLIPVTHCYCHKILCHYEQSIVNKQLSRFLLYTQVNRKKTLAFLHSTNQLSSVYNTYVRPSGAAVAGAGGCSDLVWCWESADTQHPAWTRHLSGIGSGVGDGAG